MKYTQIWYLLYSNTDPKSSQNMDYRVTPLDIAKYVVNPHTSISTYQLIPDKTQQKQEKYSKNHYFS